MPSYPADGSIALNDATGQVLLTRVRRLNTLRQKAAAKMLQEESSFYSFINGLRNAQGDRAVHDGDLGLVSCRAVSMSIINSRTSRLSTSASSRSRRSMHLCRRGQLRTMTPTCRTLPARSYSTTSGS